MIHVFKSPLPTIVFYVLFLLEPSKNTSFFYNLEISFRFPFLGFLEFPLLQPSHIFQVL